MTAAANILVEQLPVVQIVESPTNKRRRSWGNMAELTESIRQHGVLQAVLVRPLDLGDGLDGYELVYGNRRLRGAIEAGLTTIPAHVRPLSDLEALEMQIIENGQREDIHPLEEAEGYEELRDKHGISAEQIADKIGKSRAYVFARMKLLDLCAKAREAYYAGKLTASTALYVARIPHPKLQLEAIDEIGPRTEGDSPAPAREAQRIIEQRFMLRLAEAPFAIGDAELDAKAGACTTCPKRTGNQQELFADVQSPDVCTDPKCYESKCDADFKSKKKAALAEGRKVLSDKEADKLFPKWGNGERDDEPGYNSDYVRLDQKVYDGSGKTRTLESLLKKDEKIVPVLAQAPSGRAVELITRKEADALQRKMRKASTKNKVDGERAEIEKKKRDPEWEKKNRRAAIDLRAADLLMAEIDRAAEGSDFGEDVWRLLVRALLLGADGGDQVSDVCRRRWIAEPEDGGVGTSVGEPILSMLPATPLPVLRSLALELALEMAGQWGQGPALRAEAATLLGVDAKGLSKVAAKQIAAEEKAKAKALTPGVCSMCGCTELAACEGGCAWADTTHTVCTSCAK